MLNWSIEELSLKLAYSWKISRNETSVKKNFIVHLTDGHFSAKGEAAPNIRYQETPALILKEFNALLPDLKYSNTLEELTQLIDSKITIKSLRFAIESCYIHFLAQQSNKSVYSYLGLPKPSEVYTSYTIPIMDPSEVKNFIDRYQLSRFSSLKIKINEDIGEELIKEIAKQYSGRLRIDANEGWKSVDDLIIMMEKLRYLPIDFFEQPLPSFMKEEYYYLKKHSLFELIADESLSNDLDFEELTGQFHGINMKLMKAGGYINGLKILKNAENKGLKTMIGCMVETSLGIFSAINLCNHINYIDLDGHFLVENEPFSLVSEREGRLYNLI